MNLFQLSKINWQVRNKIKSLYKIKPSERVQTVSQGGVDSIVYDGVTEGDISCLEPFTTTEVLASLEAGVKCEQKKEEQKVEKPLLKAKKVVKNKVK